MDQHFEKLRLIFERLEQAGLMTKLLKCRFLEKQLRFLGRFLSEKGITTCDDKVKTVTNFPTPKSVEDVRSFVGLVGFYRAFIRGFASLARPLINLLKKGEPFVWNIGQQ